MKPVYKRMLKGMQRDEKRRKLKKKDKIWSVYILQCHDGTFYTGVTNNLERRLKMHNDGKASKYTRVRRPVEIVYQKNSFTRTQALVRECELKALPRSKKEELVKDV